MQTSIRPLPLKNIEPQRSKSYNAEHYGYQPEHADHLCFLPSGQFKMVMDRGHFEHSLASQFE
jgi:hypothetical protein